MKTLKAAKLITWKQVRYPNQPIHKTYYFFVAVDVFKLTENI